MISNSRLWRSALVLAGLIGLLCPQQSLAEDADTAWVRDYDGGIGRNDVAKDVVIDDAGYVYVTGSATTYTSPTYHGEIVTIKYDQAGDTVWLRHFNTPGTNSESGSFAALTNDGHLIIAGTFNAGGNVDVLLIKYTTDGDTVWTRTWDGSSGMQDLPADLVFVNVFGGEYFITGNTWNGTDYDIFTLCYATNGTLLFSDEYDEAGGTDEPVGIAVDAAGSPYIAGRTDISGNQDVITLKYTPAGVLSWRRLYNGPSNITEQGKAVAVDANGDIVVLGLSSTAVAVNDFVLIKYGPSGDTAWISTFDGPNADNDVPMVMSVDGTDIYVAGDVTVAPAVVKLGLLKYNSSGDTLWARYQPNHVTARDMAIDASGSVFLTGDGQKPGGFWTDWGTYKFTPAGDTAWFRWYLGPVLPATFNRPYALAPDGQGGVAVVGLYWGVDQDYSTAYYVPACSCPYQDDFDEDGFITPLDLASLIDILFAGDPDLKDASCPVPRGDDDCDGFTTPLDLSIKIDYLFASGPPPCDPCGP